MKIIFAGPSLPPAEALRHSGIYFRPPAVQGDVMAAVRQGATVIGLVDGFFDQVAPVWHKELLYALHQGVRVLGAASMGALRAVECKPFGMEGIGRIFQEYDDGLRVDDADVALLHGPAELGYPPLTVPLVNLDATLEQAEIMGLIGVGEVYRLRQAGRMIHFRDRSLQGVVSKAGLNWETYQALLAKAHIDQKRLDAHKLVEAVKGAVAPERLPQPAFTFHATPLWRRLYGGGQC